MKFSNTLLLWLCLPLLTYGQHQFDAGLSLGSTFYFGDLNRDAPPEFDQMALAYGLHFRYHLNSTWGLRGQLLRGTIAGNDQVFRNGDTPIMRNITFESTLTELSAQLVWEPFSKRRYAEPVTFKRLFSPYVFIGIGGVLLDAQPNFEQADAAFDDRIAMDEAQADDFRPVIPIGAGVNIDFSAKTYLSLEAGMRTAFTDYLDGVSEAGNPDRNDWYAFANVGLHFRFSPIDTDGDGVVDQEDTCPTEPGLATSKGCPDKDRDGLADIEDMCPEQVGPIELNGCPDRDGDVVVDLFDACPDLPGLPELEGCPDTDGDGLTDPKDTCPDKAGPAEWEGCPDSDGDTIPDHLDQCPTEKGTLELQGCMPKDEDEDGILDEVDECPTVKGLAAFNGCPDTDEDGIEDRLDKCPDKPGIGLNKGCPALTDSIQAILAKATTSVQFKTGSDVLTTNSKAVLDSLAKALTAWPEYQLIMTGHTDSQGKDSKNLELSKRRAKACFTYLQEKGVLEAAMVHDGKGEAEPIADNKTAAGRRQNRRVAFELQLNVD